MEIKVDKYLSKPVIIFGLQVSDYIAMLTLLLVVNALANIFYAFLAVLGLGIVLFLINSTGKPNFLLSIVVWLKTPKNLTVFKAIPQKHPFEFEKDSNE